MDLKQEKKRKLHIPNDIQSILMVAFTLSTLLIVSVLGLSIYARFSAESREAAAESTDHIMNVAKSSLEDDLYYMREVSDALYYNTIRETDISDSAISLQMNLLYEANKDRIVSISLFDKNGLLIAGSPLSTVKDNVKISDCDWFLNAVQHKEAYYFSAPHIENIFEDMSPNYHRVISISRAVDLTDGGLPEAGVLLIDMDYSRLYDGFSETNFSGKQYFYLCDGSGNILYHPQSMAIIHGFFKENAKEEAALPDGRYELTYEGGRRDVTVASIAYTGWKLISVTPESSAFIGSTNGRYFLLIALLLTAMALIVINRLVAFRISRPITRLDRSVKAYEAGEKYPDIYTGGSDEIRHLGASIKKSYAEIEELMTSIVHEQEEKRHSELAALQSQINPHFLYNTLDSITWMVEGGRSDEAVAMISELARLLRISLSKGKNIISLEDEFAHAQSYMNIQKVRYKDRFTADIHLPKELENFCTIKLIIQPILENAIYYGVSEMDGDGEIRVTAEKQGKDILISVSDNGVGMTPETAAKVLLPEAHIVKHGNGVGLVNVDTRLRILFGEAYGVSIESEPDEGTRVLIRFPAIEFSEENRKALEAGKIPGQDKSAL